MPDTEKQRPRDPEAKNLGKYAEKKLPDGTETTVLRIAASPAVLAALRNLSPLERGKLTEAALELGAALDT